MKVDTYSKWRVSSPLKFYETVRTTSGAHARLDDIIYSQTREVLGQHTLMEIVSGNRRQIRESITARSKKNAENFHNLTLVYFSQFYNYELWIWKRLFG